MFDGVGGTLGVLFGITETWSCTLVPETVINEAIGVVVIALITAAVLRRRRALTAGSALTAHSEPRGKELPGADPRATP